MDKNGSIPYSQYYPHALKVPNANHSITHSHSLTFNQSLTAIQLHTHRTSSHKTIPILTPLFPHLCPSPTPSNLKSSILQQFLTPNPTSIPPPGTSNSTISTIPILNRHDFIRALLTGTNGLAELGGRIVSCLEDLGFFGLGFFRDEVFGAGVAIEDGLVDDR